MNLLDRMLAHMAWADRRVHDALALAVDPPPRALEIYAHVVGAEHEWLARIEGRKNALAIWPPPDLAASLRDGVEAVRGYRALLDSPRAEDLDAPIRYVNSQGHAFVTPLGDILLQVFLHGAHHRGQILQLIRQSGGAPPLVDFIVFARE